MHSLQSNMGQKFGHHFNFNSKNVAKLLRYQICMVSNLAINTVTTTTTQGPLLKTTCWLHTHT